MQLTEDDGQIRAVGGKALADPIGGLLIKACQMRDLLDLWIEDSQRPQEYGEFGDPLGVLLVGDLDRLRGEQTGCLIRGQAYSSRQSRLLQLLDLSGRSSVRNHPPR